MPRVHVNTLLKHATENKYGVAAVNTLNVETVKYIIEAAERERVPVIVQFYPGFENYTALNISHLQLVTWQRKQQCRWQYIWITLLPLRLLFLVSEMDSHR